MNDNAIGRETPLPRIRLEVLIILVSVALAVGMNYAIIRMHCSDPSLHHTLEQLDQRYVSRDSMAAQLDSLERIMERLERQVDKLANSKGE